MLCLGATLWSLVKWPSQPSLAACFDKPFILNTFSAIKLLSARGRRAERALIKLYDEQMAQPPLPESWPVHAISRPHSQLDDSFRSYVTNSPLGTGSGRVEDAVVQQHNVYCSGPLPGPLHDRSTTAASLLQRKVIASESVRVALPSRSGSIAHRDLSLSRESAPHPNNPKDRRFADMQLKPRAQHAIHSIIDSAFGVQGTFAAQAVGGTASTSTNDDDPSETEKQLGGKQLGCLWVTSSWTASCRVGPRFLGWHVVYLTSHACLSRAHCNSASL